jgi:hypothetical protein
VHIIPIPTFLVWDDHYSAYGLRGFLSLRWSNATCIMIAAEHHRGIGVLLPEGDSDRQ